MEQLSNAEKFKLLEIDETQLRQMIQNAFLIEESHKLKDYELDSISGMIGESIALEFDTEEPVENTRASIYVREGKVVVLKAKMLNIGKLFSLAVKAPEFMRGDNYFRICIVISALYQIFYQELDEDLSKIYTYLASEYFQHGRKFNNVEIYDVVNQYVKENSGVKWTHEKINKKLAKLENELKVIECVDGIYNVKDKIYFA